MKKSLLKPQARFKRITDITTDFLEEHNIKAIILDVDNTLIDLNKNPLKYLDEWIEYIKGADIKICLASNSLKKQKIESLATKLDIPYIYFSAVSPPPELSLQSRDLLSQPLPSALA